MKSKIFLLISFLIAASCSSSLVIIDKPVSFTENRIELTKKYIHEHYGLKVDNIIIQPKIIVLHWTAVESFDSTFRIFNKDTLSSSRTELGSASTVNVSSQYVIDRDGTVFRLMPDNWMARHCIGLNYSAIGIENIGGVGDKDDLTEEQLKSNIQLIYYLKEKYKSIEYLIGHYEYTQFEDHELWRERDPNYRTKKYDPGSRFMRDVRNAVAGLKLKPALK